MNLEWFGDVQFPPRGQFVCYVHMSSNPELHRKIKTLTHKGADVTASLLENSEKAKRLKEAVSIPESEHVVFETVEDLEDALGI